MEELPHRRARTRRASLTVCVLTAIVLTQRGGLAHQPPVEEPLSFFKNFFVTGGYASAGVSLAGLGRNGIATGTIVVDGVPRGADVLAAFLYWQVVGPANGGAGATVATAGVTFKGHPLTSSQGLMATPLGSVDTGTDACWSSGAGTGSPSMNRRTYTYRQDVLRFLDVGSDGKLIANGPHEVQLPDAGPNGHQLPIALGASLVLVYRSPDASAPLRAVVLYDGGFTLDRQHRTASQTIRGFYEAEGAGLDIDDRITYIVGGGQADKGEHVRFNGETIGRDLFDGGSQTLELRDARSRGARDGDADDDHGRGSWNTVSLAPQSTRFPSDTDGEYVTTTIDVGEDKNRDDDRGGDQDSDGDCLTWGAVVYSTVVKDTDDDGLLDVWETASSALHDPRGEPLPVLGGVADPSVKDVFVEIGYFETGAPTAYGPTIKPAHTHLPALDALTIVGDAFARQGIRVHFDAGARYAGQASPYVIPVGPLARGGEALDEHATVCTPPAGAPAWVCQFSGYPGTVGWKTGYRFIRDGWVTDEGQPLLDPDALAACEASGSCRRRFDANRQHMFHYVLAAHAIGLPRSTDPSDALFRVPRTNTGAADLHGGDILLSLGGFDDSQGRPVATPFMQASTLMHELGHNAGRRHGGAAGQPNCKPNYLSVMNYLFQLRGLVDAQGRAHVDYSRQALAPLDETGLPPVLDVLSGESVQYRTAWFAPALSGAGTVMARYCTGAPFAPDAPPEPTVRVQGSGPGAVAWVSPLDVNFDGRLASAAAGTSLTGAHDWPELRLDQLASRRNVGGLYEVSGAPPCPAGKVPCLGVGPLSLSMGQGDLGQGDLGQGDLGQDGQGDLGQGDLGQGDLGQGDLGQGDLGQGDLGAGSDGEPPGEITVELADAINAPPVAVDDAYATASGTALTVPAAGLLANDTDPEQDVLHAIAVVESGPSHGAVVVNGDGSFTYTPAPGFSGIDTFQYTANDVSRSSRPATVRITVTTAIQFKGLLNLPPQRARWTVRVPNAARFRWRYEREGVVVDSRHVQHVATVTGPDGAVRQASLTYVRGEWRGALATVDGSGHPLPPGTYRLELRVVTPGYPPAPLVTFTLLPPRPPAS